MGPILISWRIHEKGTRYPYDGPSKYPINDSKGCGGVMRVAPIELFAGDRHIGELVALINRAIALAEGGEKDIDCIHELGEGWVGDEALAIAIFCALRHHNDFSAGIIAAVNHKGDSDSTGAITGNILGAHLGYAAMDDKWKKDLELSAVILELSGDLCRKCQMHEHGPKYDSIWLDKYGSSVPKYVIHDHNKEEI